MASRGAIATIHSDALKRVEAATASIVARLGIAVPPAPPHAKQPELRAAWELERQAVLMEAIDGALAGLASGDEAPAGYESFTAAMLREEIAKRGLDVKGNAKKADLIAALETADAEAGNGTERDPEPEPEPDAEASTP